MKKCLIYSVLFGIWFAILSPLYANPNEKDDTKLTKTVTRSFGIPVNGHITIINKYGPIRINSWEKDSVSIKVEITAYGKNDKSVNKIMDRVDIDFEQNKQYLYLATVLDRSSGFFTELWNNIGDYSKTLLSQNKLKIEYIIYMPVTRSLDITNKFGDIYMEDYSGKLKVTLAHGNFRAGKITGPTNMNLSFGNVHIKSIEEGELVLKATVSEFNFIGSIEIQSSSSEVLIEVVEQLHLQSKSDRKFKIEQAGKITGSSNFSKIQILSIKNSLQLDLNYGQIHLKQIEPGFTSINLKSKTTEITLDFKEGNYLDFEYEGDRDKVFISRGEEKLERIYLDDGKKRVRLSGFLGIRNSRPGKVIVKTESGELNLVID